MSLNVHTRVFERELTEKRIREANQPRPYRVAEVFPVHPRVYEAQKAFLAAESDPSSPFRFTHARTRARG